MDRDPGQTEARAPKVEPPRADRLKAALKANMGRRKAQAKARTDRGGHEAGTDEEGAD